MKRGTKDLNSVLEKKIFSDYNMNVIFVLLSNNNKKFNTVVSRMHPRANPGLSVHCDLYLGGPDLT